MPLLPQEIAPVDRTQTELTDHCLAGRTEAVMEYFLALRAETDALLAPRLPPAAGRPYPYGRCEEITRSLFDRLAQRLGRPAGPMEQVLRDFVAKGGIVRTVWGVLRDQYLQNAIQFGGLYADVSNDTVVVTKPKVEILPIAVSGRPRTGFATAGKRRRTPAGAPAPPAVRRMRRGEGHGSWIICG